MSKKQFNVWRNGKVIFNGNSIEVRDWVQDDLKGSTLGFPLLLDVNTGSFGHLQLSLYGESEDMYIYAKDQVKRMKKFGIVHHMKEETHKGICRLLDICITPVHNSDYKEIDNLLSYHIYQARMSYDDDHSFTEFCISSVRKPSFVQDVKSGRFCVDLDSMTEIFATTDRNLARALATEF